MRCGLLAITLAVTTWAQVVESRPFAPRPLPSVRQDLVDDRPELREAAVIELGLLRPADAREAEQIAVLLGEAMRDPEMAVRMNAAGLMGKNRPSEIAVPALLAALASVDRPSQPGQVETGWRRLMRRGAYARTILDSLRQHREDHAVDSVAAIVRSWPIEQFPGETIRLACAVLCEWGTRPAMDAVLEVLRRIEAIPVPPEEFPPEWPTCPPPRPLLRFDRWEKFEPITRPGDWIEIAKTFDAALISAGIEFPAGVGPLSAKSYAALIGPNSSKIPGTLAESRAASRSAASSRLTGGQDSRRAK